MATHCGSVWEDEVEIIYLQARRHQGSHHISGGQREPPTLVTSLSKLLLWLSIKVALGDRYTGRLSIRI